MARDILLLDVDHTLYARSCGVVERIDRLVADVVIPSIHHLESALARLIA